MSTKNKAPICPRCRRRPRERITPYGASTGPFYTRHCSPCGARIISNRNRFRTLLRAHFATLSVRTANTLQRSSFAEENDGFEALLRADDQALLGQRNFGVAALAEFRAAHPHPQPSAPEPQEDDPTARLREYLGACLDWLASLEHTVGREVLLNHAPNNIPPRAHMRAAIGETRGERYRREPEPDPISHRMFIKEQRRLIRQL